MLTCDAGSHELGAHICDWDVTGPFTRREMDIISFSEKVVSAKNVAKRNNPVIVTMDLKYRGGHESILVLGNKFRRIHE